MRRLLAVVTATVMVLTVSGPALAAKSGAANSSSVWIVELTTLAPTAGLRLGDNFTVGYHTKTQEPWALARCFPNPTTVLAGSAYGDGSIWGEWFSVYPGGPSPQNFVLGDSVSPVWTGGGADCTVGLYKLSGKYNGALGFTNETLLATYTFTATQ